MNNSLKNGFTLVELLIVMVILGILTTIVASSFSSSQEKARDTRRKSDLQSIAKALELYYNDYGEYPDDNNGIIMGCGTNGEQACTWGEEFIDDNNTTYMIKLPQEKTSSRNYYYFSDPVNGRVVHYALYTRLENEQDKDIPINGDVYQYYDGTDCGVGDGCNYAISSPNITPETFFPLADESL